MLKGDFEDALFIAIRARTEYEQKCQLPENSDFLIGLQEAWIASKAGEPIEFIPGSSPIIEPKS